MQSIIERTDAALARSGDYRHWIEAGGRRLSHMMAPARGGPLTDTPASVAVLAETSIEADARATALMVKGGLERAHFAQRLNLSALFAERTGDRFRQTRVGPLFQTETCSAAEFRERQ